MKKPPITAFVATVAATTAAPSAKADDWAAYNGNYSTPSISTGISQTEHDQEIGSTVAKAAVTVGVVGAGTFWLGRALGRRRGRNEVTEGAVAQVRAQTEEMIGQRIDMVLAEKLDGKKDPISR